jgi:uncharacterized protein YbaR (Trm112 family)
MHLLLTDRLTCPRCGPGFGLILLSRRTEDRRVLEGSLGCPNCRERYPVTAGFGDLRPPPREPLEVPDGEPPAQGAVAPERVQAVAAALGLGEGAGTTLLVGGAAALARPLSDLLPDIEVAVVEARSAAWPESPGVSRFAAGPRQPFFDRVLRGVALAGAEAEGALLAEARRVLAPRHRVVIVDPVPSTRARLEAAGLGEVREGSGIVVAAP